MCHQLSFYLLIKYESSKQEKGEDLIQFIWMLEVNVILLFFVALIYLYKVGFFIAIFYTLKYDGKRNVFYFITFKKSLMKATRSRNVWTIFTDTTEIKNKYILVWSCIFLYVVIMNLYHHFTLVVTCDT